MKPFDAALGFSVALHVAVLALWQSMGARPAKLNQHEASMPVVLNLSQAQSRPLANPALPRAVTQVAAPAIANATAEAAQVSPALASVTATEAAAEPDTSSASDRISSSAADPSYLPVKEAYTLVATAAGDKGGGNAGLASSSTETRPWATSTQRSATSGLPSSEPDYLHNLKPPYPDMSRRLGEQGKVLVRVLIDANGEPQKAEINQSSGFQRLDQTALNTVLKWRYKAEKRNGTPEAMWLEVPLEFRLE